MGRVPFAAVVLLVAYAGSSHGQAVRGADWWTFAGDAQRDGWVRGEQKFARDDVRNFRLLWQRKLDSKKPHIGALLPPVVTGDLAIAVGRDQNVWAMDAEQDHLSWSKHIDIATPKKKRTCGGYLTAMPLQRPPVLANPDRKPPSGEVAPFAPFQPLYLITGDGLLRQLNSSGVANLEDPIPFVPPGPAVLPLNASEDTLYTASRSGCGQEGAVWSLDTNVKTFKLGADVAGAGGVALSPSGTVYVQTREGIFDPPAGKWGGTVVALTKDLALNDYFVLPGTEARNADSGMNSTSPLVIQSKGEELVVTANRDGRIYVLRASALGADNHHKYLFRSMVVPALDGDRMHGIWGALSSWEAADGTRYILVPVWGPPSAELQAAFPTAKLPNGFIVAFKLQQFRDITSIKPAWISTDMDSPGVPVIVQGLVFALGNGKFHSDLKPKKHARATLLALDAATGEEVYSSKRQVAFAGNLTGISVSSGRVYFATVDHTIYAFGK